jgi:DNA-binding PucR family transcriptional regulator
VAVERFVRRWLSSLLDYDSRKGSELVHTLSRYLECGGNYDHTALALSVHRSTLKYRLQRIRDISGHDLTDPDTTFNLQLATRAWQTLRSLQT